MTQYDETVERQRLLLAAEEWANGIRSLHSHRMKSMWYDTRPQDTDNDQFVMDKQYNGGEIERTIYSTASDDIGTFIVPKKVVSAALLPTPPLNPIHIGRSGSSPS